MSDCANTVRFDACIINGNSITLPIKADETGMWQMVVEFNGTNIVKSIPVVNNADVVVPNVFNENYTHKLYFVKTNGTRYSNTCYYLPMIPIISTEYVYTPANSISEPEVRNEILTGVVNGSNVIFTTIHDFIPGTEEVTINGVELTSSIDYITIGNHTVQFTAAPQTGEILKIDYQRL